MFKQIYRRLCIFFISVFCYTSIYSQKKIDPGTLYWMDGSFKFEDDSGRIYKGENNICTFQNIPAFKSIVFDKRSGVVRMKGYTTTDMWDTTGKHGFPFIEIFLARQDSSDPHKLHQRRDLGESNSKRMNPAHKDGYFSIAFTPEKDDILIIGMRGEVGGATACKIGLLRFKL